MNSKKQSLRKTSAKILAFVLVAVMVLALPAAAYGRQEATKASGGTQADGQSEAYYANMYRFFNEDGMLKEERTNKEFAESIYGEWDARNQFLQSMGREDEMSDFIVKYWESYGMKKELFHANDENEAKYSVYSPLYQPEGKKFPLLVVCHGGGSTIFGAEQFGFIEEAAKRGYIALFVSWMQNPYSDAATEAGMTSDAYTFKRAYDEVIQNYPIDTTRVYVAGFSGGGNAAAYIAATFPDIVTTVMSSTGAGLQGSAMRSGGVEAENPLAHAKEIGLPLFMGYGLLDTENRWPVSDKLKEMGPHTDTTVEERLAFLNEWVEASGAKMDPVTMEQLEAFNANEVRDTATKFFGLNFNEDYTKELYGYEYLFGDGKDADGNVVLRFMGVPLAGHQFTYGWAGQYLDFAEKFARDPVTKKIITGSSTTKTPAVEVSAQTLTVDGREVICEKYNIDGHNYLKLRDLAAIFNGTAAQFGVSFDGATMTVTVATGQAYTPVGGEQQTGEDRSATCVSSDWKLVVDGKPVTAQAYNLGGNNYFKLRDLGEAIGFGVDYIEETNTAIVTTKTA